MSESPSYVVFRDPGLTIVGAKDATLLAATLYVRARDRQAKNIEVVDFSADLLKPLRTLMEQTKEHAT